MSQWNYRVVRYREGKTAFDPYTHGIHEVYYAADGRVDGMTINPMYLVGYEVDDLQWRLQEMLTAFTKPVLEYDSDSDSPEATSPDDPT